MIYYVYIIQSVSDPNFIYKGFTDNVERRFNEHQFGKANSTKNYVPFKLIHVEIVSSRKEARAMEKYFKSGYGREIIKELISEI